MILVWDMLAGILLGSCYDLLKAFRKKKNSTLFGVLCDLIFWGISLALCVYLFLLTGDSKLRFYELLGMSSGFSCYFLLFSEYFVRITEKIADFFLFFLKIPFTIIKFFAIMIKNGVLFLLTPLFFVMRLGKKGVKTKIRKFKQNWKLMKRI